MSFVGARGALRLRSVAKGADAAVNGDQCNAKSDGQIWPVAADDQHQSTRSENAEIGDEVVEAHRPRRAQINVLSPMAAEQFDA